MTDQQILIIQRTHGEDFNRAEFNKQKQLAESAPELLDALEKSNFKLNDYLYRLKDSKDELTDSPEYIQQLKDYIATNEKLIKQLKGK